MVFKLVRCTGTRADENRWENSREKYSVTCFLYRAICVRRKAREKGRERERERESERMRERDREIQS